MLTGPAEDLVQGCCSYGAHFTDAEDARRVERAAKTLTADQWQFKSRGKDGVVKTSKAGEKMTRLVKGACIFLNRPGFARGPGCALHVAAMDRAESYIDLKPDVCWQLPLRRDDEELEDGHIVTRITQWERRNWGKGGADFHWWCTEAPEAFGGTTRVVDSMRDELVAMTGAKVYRQARGVPRRPRRTPRRRRRTPAPGRPTALRAHSSSVSGSSAVGTATPPMICS